LSLAAEGSYRRAHDSKLRPLCVTSQLWKYRKSYAEPLPGAYTLLFACASFIPSYAARN
jgi:hypothetical protein